MDPRDKIIKGSYTIDKNAKITSRPKPMNASLTSLRGSSKGEQKEGLGETMNPYASNFLPLSEDENAFASKLRLDITKLQDEINKLDIDGKIRNPTNSEFKKNYINVIQKWLVRNTDYNLKELLENKINFNHEIDKILEALNVKTPQDGLKKFFKLFSLFEVLITKLTELQMVVLVKYDENFSSFIKTSVFNQVNQLSTGVNLNRFQVFLVNLERFIELLNFTNKIANETDLKSQMKSKLDLNSISSMEELLESIKNQDFRVFPEEAQILDKIIRESLERENQMQEEINQMNEKINFLKNNNNNNIKGNSEEKVKGLKENSQNLKASTEPNYYVKIIDEVREIFKEELNRYDNDLKDCNLKLMDSKIIIDNMKLKMKENEQKIVILTEEKRKILESLNKNVKNRDDDDRFEEALREEFRNMQIGFEEKIESLSELIISIKKEKGKELLEMKQQLTREIETKNLLMKKLSTFINY